MKALIKGGLCLALGWLANSAGAQELPIKWQASTAKNSSPIAVVSAPGNPSAKAGAELRPVSLSAPTPLDAAGGASAFRPVSYPFAPIIRAQAADEKIVQPIPRLEVIEIEPKQAEKMPNKDKTFPPAPQQLKPNPSPVFGNLGLTPSVSGGGDCGSCGPMVGTSLFAASGCCPDRPRYWGSAEYLMWWQRAQSVPPLVTSSPATTPIGRAGVLGQDTTTILNDSTPNHTRGGARFTLGMWLPCFCNLGIEGNYFFLGRQNDTAVFGSDGSPQISRPFFNVVTQQPASEKVAINGILTGTVSVQNFSQVWGAEANVRSKWLCGPSYWLDLLAGYRHLNISEGLDITENLQSFNRDGTPGTHFVVHDSFHTRNQFNGFQLGLDGEWRCHNRLFVGMTAKVAMGTVHQIVNIDGSTTFSNVAPFNGTFPGGLLALPTNIGRYTANRFGVLPEVGLKVGVDLTDHLRLFVGYDFMYLNNVVRPGNQIDLNVNPNFIPSAVGPGPGGGPRSPAVLFRTSDYWAQGFNFGLLYRF